MFHTMGFEIDFRRHFRWNAFRFSVSKNGLKKSTVGGFVENDRVRSTTVCWRLILFKRNTLLIYQCI